MRPNGHTYYAADDGSIQVDDQGTRLLPDMSLLFLDKSRIFPDGHIEQHEVPEDYVVRPPPPEGLCAPLGSDGIL